MAFWGIEVKPSTPFVHLCEKARGRLRISQATLGIGGPTERSVVVQCKVGNRIPVLLCSLIPSKTESCHLELEFEEADDVVFSVIGPRIVYLTGYYVLKTQQSNLQSDTESHGVNIEHSHTAGSSFGSDNDKYEESFINDDELEVHSQSPVSSSNEDDETTPENKKRKNKKVCGKRLKKKTQVIESDDDDNSCESRDWNMSMFKKKKDAVKNSTPENENRKNKKVCGKQLKKKTQVIESGDNDNSCESRDWNMSMFKKKKDAVKNSTGVVTNTAQATVETGVKLENEGEGSRKLKENVDLVEKNGKPERAKTGKKRKERSEEKANEDKQQEIDASANINVGIKSESRANDSQPEKKKMKKKKKNKKTQGEGDSDSGLHNATENQENNTFLKPEDQTANEKPILKRTLSNGLTIEEVENGPPDGKVAALGKKVKIYYTAMLKENGHVFDSNVGKSACKIRLGDEGNIDGWNLGIDGMHVGDKRRLIIPPSMTMGSGNHGSGENVPPNAWLVYDVELVGVRK